MKKFWICLASAFVGTLLGYLINQLPGIPEGLKPWVPPATLVVMGASAWLISVQMENSSKTGMSRIRIKGNSNTLKAGQNPIDDAQIQGHQNRLSTFDDDTMGGRQS